MKTENGKRRTENNTWTIIKKEFARFFGDRQLLFTSVIMPGLLIYIIYTLMGSGMSRMATEGANEAVFVRVENLPESIAPLWENLPSRGNQQLGKQRPQRSHGAFSCGI